MPTGIKPNIATLVPPLPDRVVEKLDVGVCWLWLGSCNKKGYGELGSGGRQGKTVRIHRYVWEILVGPVPAGLQLDHLCRVRRCCNPDHLEPVTQEENLRRGGPAGQKFKTHCKYGHPLVWRGSRQRCLECRRRHAKEAYYNKKES